MGSLGNMELTGDLTMKKIAIEGHISLRGGAAEANPESINGFIQTTVVTNQGCNDIHYPMNIPVFKSNIWASIVSIIKQSFTIVLKSLTFKTLRRRIEIWVRMGKH